MLATINDLNDNIVRLQDNEVLFGLDGFKKCKRQANFLMKVMSRQAGGAEIHGADFIRQLGYCKVIKGDHLEGPNDDDDDEDEEATTSNAAETQEDGGDGGNQED